LNFILYNIGGENIELRLILWIFCVLCWGWELERFTSLVP